MKFILGVSGGSGGLYAMSVLKGICESGNTCYMVSSEPGRRVLALETNVSLTGQVKNDKKVLLSKFKFDPRLIEVIDENDVGANIGTYSIFAASINNINVQCFSAFGCTGCSGTV